MEKVRGIFCLNSKCRHYFEDNCMKMFEADTVEISEAGDCKDFEAGVHIGYSDDLDIRGAATILQNEFEKKSDCYNGLVASINSVLHEESSEYLTKELAEKIAHRLIGIKYG